MSPYRTRLVAVAALALLPSHSAPATGAPLVATHAGQVRGTRTEGVFVFKGIPYAAAPMGALRWRPPRTPSHWRSVRDATRFAPDCPGSLPDHSDMSEDCLYLNVWTSLRGIRAKRPVMVWIYGGGYRGGSAANPLYDGASLAKQGVVLVSFGYRTGSLGFLATPELSAESRDGVSGNYGILDAIAALKWVRANIAAFGGDPRNVTVFGQSSGSETVNILTASPRAKGLFQRAIGESGSSFGTRRAPPLVEAEAVGVRYMRARGAANLAQLRALPFSRLFARADEKLEPNIDGWLLPEDVHARYVAGKQSDVPMLVGNTSQEFPRPPEIAAEALHVDLAREYGALAGAIAAEIGGDSATDARWQLTNREWGDFPSSIWSELQAAHGKAPVYRYLFDYAPPAPPGQLRIARHGSELGYVFGTYRRGGGLEMSIADDRLHALVSRYWVNFARTGNPNGADLPEWKPVGQAPGTFMRFTGSGAAQEPVRDARLIGLLKRHYYERDSGRGE